MSRRRRVLKFGHALAAIPAGPAFYGSTELLVTETVLQTSNNPVVSIYG